jgi:hypothetical protein
MAQLAIAAIVGTSVLAILWQSWLWLLLLNKGTLKSFLKYQAPDVLNKGF